jgi:glycosyltransferase involved in cell wall biosynthesis
MRVGFDCAPLTHPHSRGVTRVARELLAALEARGVLEVVRLVPAKGATLSTWRARELPAAVSREKLAGLHSFTSGYALRGPGARVQTIHELPWRHGVAENAGWRHRLWATLGAARATRIVVPSEHVRADLARSPFVRAALLRLVPWGVEARFAPESPPMVIDESVLTRYRLGDDPFVFAPGATRAKKNLPALLNALAERKQRGLAPLRAVVTGAETSELRAALGLASKLALGRWITTLDEVAEEDLPSLYRLARAVPVLARSEGFGLPVLEAMACGTPVIVPRASAQAEVAGEAGLVADIDFPAALADALERALRERSRLAGPSVQRAREFTWDASAQRIEELWSELA